MNSNIIQLNNLVLKTIDNRGKTPPLMENGYELIETTSIVGDNKYPNYDLISKRVSAETYNNWFRSGHPIKGDILIATVGANIGSIVIMKENRGCVAQNLVGLRINKELADPDYLYYYLTSSSNSTIFKKPRY